MAPTTESRLRLTSPALALGALVAAAFVTYAALGRLASGPRFFDDELIYWQAAASFAEGGGFHVRGGDANLGIAELYPALLSGIFSITADRELAYALAKTLNALLFALAAVPLFLLARRLLRPWPSVVAAALCVAVPSSMYVSVVMTESLAYLATATCFLAIVLTLEEPSLRRQFLALAVIGAAATARLQLVVLFPVYILALAFLVALTPRGARRLTLRKFRPTALLCAFAGAAVGSMVLASGGAGNVVGRYTVLWEKYDAFETAREIVYHFANLELYLAVVPFVLAPATLALLIGRRAADGRARAFACTFLAASIGFVLMAALFDSGQYALGRLHDRYLFYVVPLWVILLAIGVQEGAPRRQRWPIGLGAGSAVLLSLVYPVSRLDITEGGKLFEGVATTPWAMLRDAGGVGVVRMLIVGFAIAGVAVAYVGRSRRGYPIIFVASILLANTALVWAVGITDARKARDDAFSGIYRDRDWVDGHVPTHASVATLFSPYCGGSNVPRKSLYQTEFFNAAVEHARALHVWAGYSYALASTRFGARPDGTLVLPDGSPVQATYVITQPGVRVDGQRVAEGTAAKLVLWKTRGQVRIAGVRSAVDVARQACRGSRS